MADRRLRVLVLHPRLEPVGGAEVVAAWALEALSRDHDVDVLAWTEPDLGGLDRNYGTSLASRAIGVRLPPRWLRVAVETAQRLDSDPWSVQRFAALMRVARRLRRHYDVVLCTYGEADLGGPGIQYVYLPWCGTAYRDGTKPGESMARRARARIGFALRPWRLLSGFSFDRMRSNLTLAVSEGTAELVRAAYALDATVLHPPIPVAAEGRPWAQRENGFVCIGRLVAEKRIDRVLEILRRVRERGDEVSLHVVGNVQDEEPSYGRDLVDRLESAGPWVTLHRGLSRTELAGLLARQRFGIHAMVDEPFGIVVAEMIRAGCATFVRGGGGPESIVGDAPGLVFRDEDEAVERIVAMLRSPSAQEAAISHLATRADLFGTERFAEGLRHAVRSFVERAERGVAPGSQAVDRPRGGRP